MKIPKQEYTPEFRELAVKRVKEGQSIGAVAKDLGLIDQTLRNCAVRMRPESWFGSFKNERVYGERFATRDEMRSEVFKYIEVFYNRKRRHSTLGYKSSRQHLNDWFNVQPQEKLVA